MKNILEILTLLYITFSQKWIFDGLSGTFRLGSRMFLVCFSFTLRSNFASDRFIPRIFLVQPFPQFPNKNIFNDYGSARNPCISPLKHEDTKKEEEIFFDRKLIDFFPPKALNKRKRICDSLCLVIFVARKKQT
jgi:hypothetical protein